MMNYRIKIGIPRALLYYKYGDLWENFFNDLDCEIVHSPETNNEILEKGKKLSVDESCLSLKIYMGHVDYLIGKVDYILIPRIVCLKKREKLCTNFSALYDIVNNVFETEIIEYNVDMEKGENEKKAFLAMGKRLNKKRKDVLRAYLKAKRIMERNLKHKLIKQDIVLATSDKKKILLVGHSYNIYDNLIGKTIINIIKKEGADVIYADIFDKKEIKDKYKVISEQVYWTYSKELLSSIVHYYDQVDGIILLSVFPCGPDSLTNEMCIRKIKKPITTLIIDELTSETGLQTRIESFIDIINRRGRKLRYDQKNN